MTKIALSIGGNRKNSIEAFYNAFSKLRQYGLCNFKCAKIYRTPPVGCVPGTPDFYNTAITGEWPRSINFLFKITKQLEREAGRPMNHNRFDSRILDIDIIFFGNLILDTPELSIPHPQAWWRLFVLIPLADIAPNWPFPGKNTSVEKRLMQLKNIQKKEYESISPVPV